MQSLAHYAKTAARYGFWVVVLWAMSTHPAYADLQGSLTNLLDQVKALSTPIAVILLIVAGWQRMMGNTHIFIAALIGTVIMFGAPQIVELISAVFIE